MNPPEKTCSGLMYIDMAYTVDRVRERHQERFLEARHSAGFFRRVWGVHPLADAVGKPPYNIDFIRFTPRQLVIEGVATFYRLPRFLLPLNFLLSQWKLFRILERLIRKHDIPILAATDSVYAGLLALMLKRRTGRPLAVAVYSNQDDLYAATGALAMPRLLPFRWLERLVARAVLSNADVVMAGNRNNLQYALNNGATGDTAIIPVARNTEAIHFVDPKERETPDGFLEERGIPTGRPAMLYVGRLLELKHPDSAVRAMSLVIERRPEAIGLLAGGGPMQPALEALVEELGMAGRIHFLGQIDQVALSRLIPHCLTVSPLTGMALIECGLGGSPIVAFDRDWQAEFVEDGANGFIVPFLDEKAMADRLLALFEDAELRERMSRTARQRALDFADVDRIFAQEQAVFSRLLTSRSRESEGAPTARSGILV